MSDFPSVLLPPFPVITPFSEESLGSQVLSAYTVPTSRVVVANTAYFYPFRLDLGATAVKMAAMNGAAVAGTIDVGIYDNQFNYVITLNGGSGSSATQTTTSVIQEYDIDNTYLPPGLYWMALSGSSASGAFFFAGDTSDEIDISSYPTFIQTSAHPLPTTTAAPVIDTASTPLGPLLMCVSFDTLI